MKSWPDRRSVVSSFLVIGLLALATCVSVAQGDESSYLKQATWQETMLASRAKLAEQPEPSPAKLGPWFTTGPLKANGFSDALFPEQGVDLDAKGSDNQPLWQQKPELLDGQVINLTAGGGSESTYLFRTITVDRKTILPAGFGSDDGLAVWLNGKQILSVDAARGVGANSDLADLELAAGENQLLLKIYNSGGGHGYYFSATPEQSNTLLGLWQQIEQDFPLQCGWMKGHLPNNRHLAWFHAAEDAELEKEMIGRVAQELGNAGGTVQAELGQLVASRVAPTDRRWLDLYEKASLVRHLPDELKRLNVEATRLAIVDLVETFGSRYAKGQEYLRRINEFDHRVRAIQQALAQGDKNATGQIPDLIAGFLKLREEALLANPLLEFDRLLFVRRAAGRLGLPQNWQGNCAIAKDGYDNEIAVLSPVSPQGKRTTLFKPDKGEFVGDVDLHFDADRMLFSMPGSNGRWQIFEVGADGKGLRQMTTGEHADVDDYDACYLPDGRIIFDSTRCFHGVPCVGGGNTVANLFIMDDQGQNVRQLCFDQDHDWCPTVLNDGRVLYSRWEYSDSPHYFTRLLFHMNPDGTNQMEYYASNSHWPNSIFYARPIPNHPTKVVAVISGHHGVPRMGELLIFDPALGRHQADGAVQQIPGYGKKVEPRITDGLVNGSWPKFLHPYPLSDKYFLVSCQPDSKSLWGIYLVDIYDNMLLLQEEPGYAYLEPLPFRKTLTPPVIPDRVDPRRKDALVYLSDVYFGKGLQDVPEGTVKKLRVYEFHFAYPRMGGHINIGIDGPWDGRRILGTVPVEKDGSASFFVPANTPIAVQPLDEDEKSLQVMRSWYTAMPGETISCVGCHESQNSSPPSKPTLAMKRAPSQIDPWYGPARGFGFKREVQPVLDEYCVGCHNGEEADRPDFRVDGSSRFNNFTPSYVALHPYVRRPGPESDYFMQKPLEFHAGTSELIQMLEKGHHNVKLDAEAWDRLITWIDLNVPDHGTWHEHRAIASEFDKRRMEMRKLYANIDINPEEILEAEGPPIEFVQPEPMPKRNPPSLHVAGWPFDTEEAKRRQLAPGEPTELKLELAEGLTLDMVRIPAGEFAMGDADGEVDEYPPAAVKIDKPFYLGRFEVTNAQYALFDPSHDSAYISVLNKDQSSRGLAANGGSQPVIRVTWQQATDFCRWLSDRTGQKFDLPTEAQWEYACRAGTATPLNYGDLSTDFGRLANLADERVHSICRGNSPKWIPNVPQVSDGSVISDNVGKYAPNAWGLCDMHGNVAEWTRTAYRPYPYDPGDGRDQPNATGTKSVRGGSWYDRPQRARSAFRMNYQPWQYVYNVGFRVVMEAAKPGEVVSVQRD